MSADPRIREQIAGTCLEPRLEGASLFFERRGADLEKLELAEPVARGLARLLASSAEFARYLSLRPQLLAQLAERGADGIRPRTETLEARAPTGWGEDLEGFVDGLRLFRRDEMAFAACLQLGGLVPFEQASEHLSRVAELAVERAHAAARDGIPGAESLTFSILAMGKRAGRELTYHSDLDLIFLYDGDTEAVQLASRLAQRFIHYLSTPTGAGTAYAIDARLRPSGRQGSLVISYAAYVEYQLERSQTWEHLALMRCRALGGDVSEGASALGRVQDALRARGERPWRDVAQMRARVAAERGAEGADKVAIKTAPGGLMDVDFLAAGAQLERGASGPRPDLPAIPELLGSVASGDGLARVLDGYRLLRRIEACARWVAGRPLEVLETSGGTLAVVAELVEPGLTGQELLERLEAARTAIRDACERVLAAGTIAAL